MGLDGLTRHWNNLRSSPPPLSSAADRAFPAAVDRSPSLVVRRRKAIYHDALMKLLPETEDTPLIRTDFANDAAWEKVCSEALELDPRVRQALEFSFERNRAEGQPTGRPVD